MIKSRLERTARNLIGGTALRIPPIARKVAGTISGIGIEYPHHPRAADVALRGGGRLYEALRDGRFVLVVPDGVKGAGLDGATVDGVRVVRSTVPGPVVLVRPDGYIGWAADAPSRSAVEAGIAGWISPATPGASSSR
jgi:hypothetical protein